MLPVHPPKLLCAGRAFVSSRCISQTPFHRLLSILGHGGKRVLCDAGSTGHWKPPDSSGESHATRLGYTVNLPTWCFWQGLIKAVLSIETQNQPNNPNKISKSSKQKRDAYPRLSDGKIFWLTSNFIWGHTHRERHTRYGVSIPTTKTKANTELHASDFKKVNHKSALKRLIHPTWKTCYKTCRRVATRNLRANETTTAVPWILN